MDEPGTLTTLGTQQRGRRQKPQNHAHTQYTQHNRESQKNE